MSNLIPSSQKILEIGIDEAGRGCLAGPVVAAAVCMPDISEINADDRDIMLLIKDSKKMTPKNRALCKIFIESYAIGYAVGISENTEIDQINILNATHLAMHRAISNLEFTPDHIFVDGNSFKEYYSDKNELIDYSCVIGGDDKYLNIACASILAKETHDELIRGYISIQPELDKRYDWNSNVCYGTEKHRNGISLWGLSKYHRKSFGICKNREITI